MDQLPLPMSPPDCDLRGYDFVPLFGHKLFQSKLYRMAIATNPRAGLAALKLWWTAWNEVPAGSLPDDDVELSVMADFGADMKAWAKVKTIALHGFIKCSDGRLYHPMLSEEAVESYDKRLKALKKRETDRKRLNDWRERHRKPNPNAIGNSGLNDAEPPIEASDETGGETRFKTPESSNETRVGPGKTEDSKKEPSLRSGRDGLFDDLPVEPHEPAELTPGQRLFGEGLATLARLSGKAPESCKPLLGKWARMCKDDARLLALILDAERDGRGNVAAWVEGCLKKPAPTPKPSAPCLTMNDPPEAWAAFAESHEVDSRTGISHPVVEGYYIDTVAERVGNAAGIAYDVKVDWTPVFEWLRLGLTDDAICAVIRKTLSGPKPPSIHSLRFFDNEMRKKVA